MTLGRIDAAQVHSEAAFRALEQVGTPAPRPLLARLHLAAAQIAFARENWDEAKHHLEKQIALFADVAADANVSSSEQLAVGYLLRSEIHRKQREFLEAEQDLEAACRLFERLVEGRPERMTNRIVLTKRWRHLALIKMALGRREEAHHNYERAFAEAGALHEEAPRHLGVMVQYAEALKGLGQVASDKAVRDHAKGTPGRRKGIKEAVAFNEQALDVYVEIETQGRLDDMMRDNMATLRRIVDFHKQVLARADAADAQAEDE